MSDPIPRDIRDFMDHHLPHGTLTHISVPSTAPEYSTIIVNCSCQSAIVAIMRSPDAEAIVWPASVGPADAPKEIG